MKRKCVLHELSEPINTVLSDSSEKSYHDAETVEVPKPPPKADVRIDQMLTFPMGTDQPALPICEGPRLEPFSNGDVKVQFIRELGENAAHSNVFEVKINGKRYALKLFRTFTSGLYPHRQNWPRMWETLPEPRDAAYYFRPFYRECRAYARISERRLQDRYCQCYGYLKLPSELRRRLCDITGLPEYYWQVRPPEIDGRTDKPTYTIEEQLSRPIYVLVKEFVSGPAIDSRQRPIRSMLTDLRLLHKAGIVNCDLADRNYVAGRIIDFSSSYTLPHIWFSKPRIKYDYPHSGWWRMPIFSGRVRIDRYVLEKMILESGVKTKAVQAMPKDWSVGFETRGCRNRRARSSQKLAPFYELGVNEPEPPIDSSALDSNPHTVILSALSSSPPTRKIADDKASS